MDMIVFVLGLMLSLTLLLLYSNYKISLMIGKSMRPTISHFAIGIYYTEYSENIVTDIEEGDIILFKEASGKQIAHRVKKINEQENKMYVTGDNILSSQHIIPTRQEDRENIEIIGILVKQYPVF